MSRKNYTTTGKAKLPKHYDLAYTHLPEHPELCRIVCKATNTIYVNLDAAFEADGCYIADGIGDHILSKAIRGRYDGWRDEKF